MKLEYRNANYLLINEFEEMKIAYENDLDDYGEGGHEDNCYGLYEREFTPYILKQLQENNIPELKKIFNFVEKLMNSRDFELANMVGVAVVESLFFDGVCVDFKDTLLKYCGKATLQSFIDCFCEEEKAEWEKYQAA